MLAKTVVESAAMLQACFRRTFPRAMALSIALAGALVASLLAQGGAIRDFSGTWVLQVFRRNNSVRLHRHQQLNRDLHSGWERPSDSLAQTACVFLARDRISSQV
jgi:hypothetical protein